MVRLSSSTSVAVTLNLSMRLSSMVRLPNGRRISGASLTAVTFSVNISRSFVIPSVTLTRIG